ncbi:hypothetical protein [Sulfuriferula sp. AH1]|uniref:hypothetical protein n=1 Tax=Sulfuriferula sp. AH1 TaxID=1985873 RepID=UPI0012FB4999|nr:hypothetical protein [Sulfuriferula sp. AH1]
MSVSDAEIVRRRRAVFTGLRPYLPEHLLLQAVTCWQQKYVNKPMFALNKFLFEICDTPALAEQRADMHRSLMEALWADESALAPDPLLYLVADDLPLPQYQTASMRADQRSAPTQLFDNLITEFLESLSSVKQDADVRARNALAASLAEEVALAPRLAAPIANWILGVHPVLEDGLSVQHMQALLHVAYVQACDAIGPVRTDNLLTAAIHKTESLAVAKTFDVRKFL